MWHIHVYMLTFIYLNVRLVMIKFTVEARYIICKVCVFVVVPLICRSKWLLYQLVCIYQLISSSYKLSW